MFGKTILLLPVPNGPNFESCIKLSFCTKTPQIRQINRLSVEKKSSEKLLKNHAAGTRLCGGLKPSTLRFEDQRSTTAPPANR